MANLSRADQRVLTWLERADFQGKGCRHSQDTIALATKCSRRTVIRAIQALTEAGRITVSKERRPGCKWLCNVYRVRDRNPHKRAEVLNVLDEIRPVRRAQVLGRIAQCHTEGTTAPRAPTSVEGSPSPRCVCGRARAKDQIPARRRSVCDNCNKLLEENKRLLAHVREGTCEHCATFLRENEQLTNEVSGLMHTTRKLASENTALRLAANPSKDSQAHKDIEFVITRWRRLCGHPKAKCPVDGKAWKAVKRALGPWEYSLMEVLEVVEGVALAPYDAGYGKRKVAGTPKERKDDLAYALRDEINIAKFRDISARARGATYDQLNLAHIELMSTEALYLQMMIDACNRHDTTSLLVARAWHYSVGEEAPVRAEYRHELDEDGRLPREQAA